PIWRRSGRVAAPAAAPAGSRRGGTRRRRRRRRRRVRRGGGRSGAGRVGEVEAGAWSEGVAAEAADAGAGFGGEQRAGVAGDEVQVARYGKRNITEVPLVDLGGGEQAAVGEVALGEARGEGAEHGGGLVGAAEGAEERGPEEVGVVGEGVGGVVGEEAVHDGERGGGALLALEEPGAGVDA